MTRLQFSLSCALVVAMGCTKDASFTEPIPPLAAVHWMEAVPDTGSMDMRPIDIISNATGGMDLLFRGSKTYYDPIEAGTRHIRIFLSGPNPVNASTIILDTSVTFTAANSYTLIHTGFARTGSAPSHTLWVVPDGAADPGAGNIGLRILHAGVGMGPVDVRFIRHASDTLADAPDVANLAYKGIGNYFTLPHDSLGADTLRIVVTATGTKAPVLFAALRLPVGVPGSLIANPVAGARVAKSVITAVIVPPSVAGSAAPQGGLFAAPSVVFLVDRRPPNTMPQ